jgi:hypothetical protein
MNFYQYSFSQLYKNYNILISYIDVGYTGENIPLLYIFTCNLYSMWPTSSYRNKVDLGISLEMT